MDQKSNDIVLHEGKVTKEERQKQNRYKSCVLWFTGLSGSGKSTIAADVEKKLHNWNVHSYVLDGDNIRHGLNRDLGFSSKDRTENIRRIGEVSKLFVDAGFIVLTAAISPYQKDREMVRKFFELGEFIEVYVKCPLEECARRDPKGLYQRAKMGEIRNFTGISAPYEPPVSPEVVIETDHQSIEESVRQVINYLQINGYFGERTL